MADVLLDALLDTLKVLPFLFLIYIVIELLEHKTDLMGGKTRLGGKLGPLIGSATGLIPQCGFSVMAAKLFEQKLITVGTLLAIFLSTSDEAFILLLSSGDGAVYLLPMIIVKIVVGVAVGYLADLLIKKKEEKEEPSVHDVFVQKEQTCTSCGRDHDDKNMAKTYLLYPFLHSLKVAFTIFLVNFALGAIITAVGEEKFVSAMEKSAYVQPLLTSLVGLIPNCASSVVLTECFLKDGILFGSCVAGLCANAGLGFVVLLKNYKEWKRNLLLILTSYVVAVGVGELVNFVMLTWL